jgi:Mn2+/Fe2+ NRAMP family transporter
VRVEQPQLDVTATQATHSVVVRSTWQKHVLTFLMVFGPGLIVMEVDNDAGAVSTYMQAGGQYGICCGC